MHYYIYKITNNVNGNFYIGRRQCECPIKMDDYFGSGKRLKAAIKKYGKHNFTKEVIRECSDYDKLVQTEKELVTNELINNNMCYNLALGGHGGYTFYKNRIFKHSSESKAKISAANKGRKRPELSENNHIAKYWVNKKRSDEDKQKKSSAAKKRVIKGTTDFAITVTCPHCNREGQRANMMRWHFDKCRAMFK